MEDPYPVVDGCLRRHPGLSDSVAMSGYHVCTVRRFILLVWLVESEDGRSVRERRRRFQKGAHDCPRRSVSASTIGSIANDGNIYIDGLDLHLRCRDPRPGEQRYPNRRWRRCPARESSRSTTRVCRPEPPCPCSHPRRRYHGRSRRHLRVLKRHAGGYGHAVGPGQLQIARKVSKRLTAT